MFFSKPQENKIKPLLDATSFLLQKLQRTPSSEKLNIQNACLLKYFPKYHRNLEISLIVHPKSVQNKVRLLKIVHHFHCEGVKQFLEEKALKKLLKSSRKTLKSLPTSQCYNPYLFQRHYSLSRDFPRVTSLDLSQNQSFKGYHHLEFLTRSMEKELYKSYGYFWESNQLVKKLKISNHDLYYWMMLKKLGESKRFLKSLKTIELNVGLLPRISIMRCSLIEFLKNKEFLECVTLLKFENSEELSLFSQFMDSLINSCQRLSYLSLPIHLPTKHSVGFSLNLCKLENLQELELEVGCTDTFIYRVELPHSLRKMTFQTINYGNFGGFPDIFDSLEKFQSQQDFFNKWRSLHNLKVLTLIIPTFYKNYDTFKDFIVPLLKAIPQLETFIYKWTGCYMGHYSPLDLDFLLEGIEPLRSLKNLEISKTFGEGLQVTYNPQKVYFLPHVTSIKIDGRISADFDLKKFITAVFYNVKLKVPEMNKIVQLSSLKISCAKEFIKIIQLLQVLSEFKTVKFEMKIELIDQTLSSLLYSFRYPIYIAKNVLLTVGIKLLDSTSPIYLTEEKLQHLRMAFGQFNFTISYREKHKNYGFYPVKEIILLSNQKRIP